MVACTGQKDLLISGVDARIRSARGTTANGTLEQGFGGFAQRAFDGANTLLDLPAMEAWAVVAEHQSEMKIASVHGSP